MTTTEPLIASGTLAALRREFPAENVGKLPRSTCQDCSKKLCDRHTRSKCGVCGAYMGQHIHIDYVGHAEVTDRLLDVDPLWSWEPVAFDSQGLPAISKAGNTAELWIRLTVAGVTRLGVGTAPGNQFELPKVLIGDAIRNAAMRFGVALDLWAKSDLHSKQVEAVDEFAPEVISPEQLQQISDVFGELPDEDRTRVKVDWARELDCEVSWTPKHRFVEVLNSAITAVKKATAAPVGGRVEDAALAAKRCSLKSIRDWGDEFVPDTSSVSWSAGKEAALIGLSEITSMTPSAIVDEIVGVS